MKTDKITDKYRSLPVQVRASFWFLVCSFLQKGIAVVTTPIFTRIMSAADYGQFGVFKSWYGIVTIVVGLSLTSGVHIQGLVKFDKDRDLFSSSLQGLSTSLILSGLLVYLLFRNFWNQILSLSTLQMLCMFAIIWSVASFGFWANEQRVKYAYKSLVVVTLISAIVAPMLEIILVLHSEDKATAMIVGWAISSFLCFGWTFVWRMRHNGTFFLGRFWKYALLFNIPLVPHYLSQTVLNSADRIMIQRMVGDSEAGIYTLAYSVALLMLLFNSSLLQALNPWIYQKIKEKRETDIAPAAYSTMLLVAGVNLFLILLSPEAVAVFAPKEYYDAIWIIPPVAISVYFIYIYDLFAKFAFYYEKTVAIMLASVVGAVLNIVLNALFIPKFGYMAAGYTTFACYLVYAAAHYLFMLRVCRKYCEGRYPYDTGKIVAITFAFVLVGLLLLTTYRHTVVRYVILAAFFVGAIAYRQQIAASVRGVLKMNKTE